MLHFFLVLLFILNLSWLIGFLFWWFILLSLLPELKHFQEATYCLGFLVLVSSLPFQRLIFVLSISLCCRNIRCVRCFMASVVNGGRFLMWISFCCKWAMLWIRDRMHLTSGAITRRVRYCCSCRCFVFRLNDFLTDSSVFWLHLFSFGKFWSLLAFVCFSTAAFLLVSFCACCRWSDVFLKFAFILIFLVTCLFIGLLLRIVRLFGFFGLIDSFGKPYLNGFTRNRAGYILIWCPMCLKVFMGIFSFLSLIKQWFVSLFFLRFHFRLWQCDLVQIINVLRFFSFFCI